MGNKAHRSYLLDLPAIPAWFEEELAGIATVEGTPLYKIVDGQREKVFRNGKMDIKHLFQTEKFACYQRIPHYKYRRKNFRTGEWQEFDTKREAEDCEDPHLMLLIEKAEVGAEVRAVGRPCWVIEICTPLSDYDPKQWQMDRFRRWERHGVFQQIDVKGPYPTENLYAHFMDVLDEDGNAVAPNRETLDECSKRYFNFLHSTKNYEQRIRDYQDREKKFEEQQTARLIEEYHGEQAFGGITDYFGVISKPITRVKA